MTLAGRRRDGALVMIVALVLQLAVATWAGTRFPPIADGVYYQRLAERLAGGAGYTWLWPDGAVTFAAHYPVGYPALLAGFHAALGAGPWSAMLLNVLLGTLAAGAGWSLASRVTERRAALVAALASVLEPATLLYVPAVMTEAVTAHLLVIAAWMTSRAAEAARPGGSRGRWLLGLGLLMGLATLVRPQVLVLAPLLGVLAGAPERLRGRLVSGAVVLALALGVCAPWTLRNCARMKSCALVSVNGGWNLLIGIGPRADGHWAPVDVPEACKTVWDEAGKDACFGREARARILAEPGRFLRLVPLRLAATFDYGGAAPWYLHESNGGVVSERGKQTLAVVETVFHRLALALALLGLGLAPGPRRGARALLALLGTLIALGGLVLVTEKLGWVATLTLPVVWGLFGNRALRLPVLLSATAAVIVTTAAVHAVFFGAGRYGLVVYPLITLSACALFRRR